MTQAVLTAVLTALTDAGVYAVAQYPASALDKKTPTVCVGVRSQTVETPGFGSYLGKEEVDGVMTERYGVKVAMTVLLDLYLPGTMAEECQRLFARVSGALAALPSGVKLRKMTRGELAPDPAVEMLRCECAAECTAYFSHAVEEESGVWHDFVLRGVMRNERE